MQKLLIYGSRDFGRVVKELAQECGREVAGFVDDVHTGADVLGDYPTCLRKFPPSAYEMVLAIGYNDLKARWKVFEKITKDGYRLPTLVHPRAFVSPRAKIESGGIVMMGALVDTFARLGPGVVLWPGVVVSHDCAIGANSFLSPGCTVCGFTEVGPNTFVGAGSVIADHVKIPSESFLKAGQVHK